MIHITYVLNGVFFDHLRFRRRKAAIKWIEVLRERGAHSFRVGVR